MEGLFRGKLEMGSELKEWWSGTNQWLLDFGDTCGAHSCSGVHTFTPVLKNNTNSNFLKYVI